MRLTTLARAMHGVIEPFHAIAYFAPEVADAFDALGLEPRGQGYVAGRAAPLGAIGPDVAAALFYNFNPALFAHVLPAAWGIASPAAILEARGQAMQAVYERVGAPTGRLAEATDLARLAVTACATHGRPLAAANRAVHAPGLPFADLWQALTVLREHRGDGHIALLTATDLGPVEALVLYSGWQSRVSRRFLQRTRLWDDAAWTAGVVSLERRGLATEDGLTGEGLALRESLETDTDRLASGPWTALGEAASLRLFDLLMPLVTALNDAQAYPRPFNLPDRPA
ncbi:MAG TPA: hypothetical protein VMM13_14335 [Euzebya sp.]|nr:hypothetical protein [Euzebya sp.]